MTTYLPDVNFWIALLHEDHVHHMQAQSSYLQDDSSFLFCRITELSLLRLSTNVHVMGDKVLGHTEAVDYYTALRQNAHIGFAHEPLDFDTRWRSVLPAVQAGAGNLTDAYLSSLAAVLPAAVLTFDRRFHSFLGAEVIRLKS